MSLKGIILTSILSLVSLSAWAEEFSKNASIHLDSVRAEYFEEKTGEVREKEYQVLIESSGSVNHSPDLAINKMKSYGSYNVILQAKGSSLDIKRIKIVLYQISEMENNSYGVNILGAIYEQVNDVLGNKYEEKGDALTSITLVGAYVQGSKTLFRNNNLRFFYHANLDFGIREIRLEGLAGLGYKQINLLTTAEYRKSEHRENSFVDTRAGLELNYNYSDDINLGFYGISDKIDFDDSDLESSEPDGILKSNQIGFIIEYFFD